MKEYYVYIYLNPLKSGKFVYGIYKFEYEPFYVGKGKDNRLYYHTNESEKNTINTLKYNVLQKIKRSKLEPIILKIKTDLTSKKAFNIERHFIKIIGRRDTGNGPLVNLTDGGRGRNNYKVSNITREKMRISHIGHKVSDITKEKISKANAGKNNPWFGKTGPRKGIKLSDSTKEKMSIKRMKPIIQYDKDFKFIKQWPSIKAIKQELGYNISNCCNGLVKTKSGYIWRYGYYSVAPSIKIIKK